MLGWNSKTWNFLALVWNERNCNRLLGTVKCFEFFGVFWPSDPPRENILRWGVKWFLFESRVLIEKCRICWKFKKNYLKNKINRKKITLQWTRVFLLPCQRRCLRSIWRHWFPRYFCHFCRLKKEELNQLVSFTFHVECWVCVACMDLKSSQ